jgi:hypothetical protein
MDETSFINDPQYLDKLYSFITRMPTANGAHLWIGGDFNLGDINWEKETVNEYATNGTQGNQLLTIFLPFDDSWYCP